MKERKSNERPAAATAERSTGAISCPGADSSTTPYTDYTNAAGRSQGTIEQLLLPGAENAVTTRQLLAATGIRYVADLQKQIERERAAGALILSKCYDGGGYYLPASRDEIARYVQTLSRRAKSTFRTLRAARRVLREVPGQTQFAGGGDRGQA